jgi:hypothetical protein
VDPFKKLVSVRQAVWRGTVQTPKTKNAIRNIPIPVEIVDALRTHINGRTWGFVFTTKNGTPWNSDIVLQRHLLGKLKVDGHLHMFRAPGSGEGQRTRKASNASVTSLHDIKIFRRATEANSFKICTLTTPPDARSSSACALRRSSCPTA